MPEKYKPDFTAKASFACRCIAGRISISEAIREAGMYRKAIKCRIARYGKAEGAAVI